MIISYREYGGKLMPWPALFNRKRKAKAAKAIRIGVASAAHNTGVTTFSIALTNFLCSKRRRSAAYIELNSTGEIHTLKEFKGEEFRIRERKSPAEGLTCFCLNDMDLYPEAALTALPQLYAAEYSYYVLDLGVISPRTEAEFLRCDLRFFLCDFSPWKQEQLSLLLQEMTKDKRLQQTITLLGNSGSCRRLPRFLKDYSYHIRNLPYLPNPFLLTSGDFAFFENILKGV